MCALRTPDMQKPSLFDAAPQQGEPRVPRLMGPSVAFTGKLCRSRSFGRALVLAVVVLVLVMVVVVVMVLVMVVVVVSAAAASAMVLA